MLMGQGVAGKCDQAFGCFSFVLNKGELYYGWN